MWITFQFISSKLHFLSSCKCIILDIFLIKYLSSDPKFSVTKINKNYIQGFFLVLHSIYSPFLWQQNSFSHSLLNPFLFGFASHASAKLVYQHCHQTPSQGRFSVNFILHKVQGSSLLWVTSICLIKRDPSLNV